jgi:hypothetical protein
MSVRNGSTQSWLEFNGSANANVVGGGGTYFSTVGSLLIIDPTYDLSLPDYISSGSSGQYNLQFGINVTNQSGEDFAPEIVTICVNSGVMVTTQGSTSTYTGLLTKSMVLDAKGQKGMSSAMNERLVGGKILNRGLRKAVRDFVASKVGGVMSGSGSSKMASFI